MSDVLFAAWDGGGAVPPTLDLAQELVRRGHAVRVLADPTLREEVVAVGATFRSWTRAPHRTAPGAENEVVRDWEARTPLGAFQRVRDRLICGPAQAFAEDVLEELRRQPADIVVAEAFLRGALMAAEAADRSARRVSDDGQLRPDPGRAPVRRRVGARAGPAGRVRDRAVAAASRRLWNGGLERLNAARAHVGLPPVADVQADIARTIRCSSSRRALSSTRRPARRRTCGMSARASSTRAGSSRGRRRRATSRLSS